MYTFKFYYVSNKTIEIKEVTKVEYHLSQLETVSNEQILETRFPINKTLYLYGDGFSDVISGIDLIHIEITKE